MIRRPPRSTQGVSSAASDVYKRQSPPYAPPDDSSQRAKYTAAVEQIRAWIAQGDCYQINMTRAVEPLTSADPWLVYRQLRRSDAAFGAFLRVRPDLAVLCNSPELLLHGEGAHLRSEPIKGTRARATDPSADRARRDALVASHKDLAELTMIVDLCLLYTSPSPRDRG